MMEQRYADLKHVKLLPGDLLKFNGSYQPLLFIISAESNDWDVENSLVHYVEIYHRDDMSIKCDARAAFNECPCLLVRGDH